MGDTIGQSGRVSAPMHVSAAAWDCGGCCGKAAVGGFNEKSKPLWGLELLACRGKLCVMTSSCSQCKQGVHEHCFVTNRPRAGGQWGMGFGSVRGQSASLRCRFQTTSGRP